MPSLPLAPAALGALLLLTACGSSGSATNAPAASITPAATPTAAEAPVVPSAPAPATAAAATAAASITPVMAVLSAPDRYAGKSVTIVGGYSGACCPSGNCASGVVIKDGLAGLTVMPPAGYQAPKVGSPVRATGVVRIYSIPGANGTVKPFPVIEATELVAR